MNTNPQPATSNRAVRITLLGVGAFALVLFVFLGLVLWQNPVRTILQCSRATNLCSITQARHNQTQTWPVALDSLTGARVVHTSSVGLRGAGGYQVYLQDAHASYYFTVYNTLTSAAAAVKSINDFIAESAQPELVIVHDESSMNTLAWILMIFMPLLVIGMLVFAWRKLLG